MCPQGFISGFALIPPWALMSIALAGLIYVIPLSITLFFDEGDLVNLEEKNKCIIFAVEFIGMDWLRSSTE